MIVNVAGRRAYGFLAGAFAGAAAGAIIFLDVSAIIFFDVSAIIMWVVSAIFFAVSAIIMWVVSAIFLVVSAIVPLAGACSLAQAPRATRATASARRFIPNSSRKGAIGPSGAGKR